LPCNFCYYFGSEQTNAHNAFGNFSTNSDCRLFNFKSFALEDSNPITITEEITNKDLRTNGNTKTLIRLLKNLKADAFKPVTLTGHQISSIICSMEDYTLSKPSGQLLFLLLEVSLYLKKINDNPFAIRSVKSPDDYPLINSMNEESFIHGINQLKAEMDSLIKHLVLEIDLYTDIYSVPINH